jgi:hypothetical protein
MFLGGVSSLDHFDAGTSVYLIQVFEKKMDQRAFLCLSSTDLCDIKVSIPI